MSQAPLEQIRLPRRIVNCILGHVQEDPVREACGFLAAREGKICNWYPVCNIARDAALHFEMDPREQIAALRRMREAGEDLFAIYHSHPTAPAHPSASDLAEAGYPEALYLIVSLDTQGVLEMRGYRIQEGQVTEVALAL
ncbi:MAG: Mov34/MPN/PAD-1 family protein [Gammaproteobacteria bacterium]